MIEAISPIGRVVGTERKPNTPHEFHFWTATQSDVGIGALVKVVMDGERPLTVYGIVVDGASYTDLQTALHDYIGAQGDPAPARSEEHTSELQSQSNLVCRLLLEK